MTTSDDIYRDIPHPRRSPKETAEILSSYDWDTLSNKVSGTKLDRGSEKVMLKMIDEDRERYPDKSSWLRAAAQYFARDYLQIRNDIETEIREKLANNYIRSSPPPAIFITQNKLSDEDKQELLEKIMEENAEFREKNADNQNKIRKLLGIPIPRVTVTPEGLIVSEEEESDENKE